MNRIAIHNSLFPVPCSLFLIPPSSSIRFLRSLFAVHCSLFLVRISSCFLGRKRREEEKAQGQARKNREQRTRNKEQGWLGRGIAAVIVSMLILSGCGKKEPAATAGRPASASDPKVVRTAVIGGMTMTGLWGGLSKMFEQETGYQVKVVSTGPRPIISAAFIEGQADLLTMHSGDITTDLVADGYGMNMRPWTRNELVIVGPKSDPAGIRGLTDGAEAFRKIAGAKANFVDFEGIGSREVCHKIWKKAGVPREGEWVIKDESSSHLDVLDFTHRSNAYVVVGLMPVIYEKLTATDMEILVQGDPAMQRPYIVMEANPAKLPGVNSAGARALADFLVSEKVQRFLADFGKDRSGAGPLFYPISSK